MRSYFFHHIDWKLGRRHNRRLPTNLIMRNDSQQLLHFFLENVQLDSAMLDKQCRKYQV